MHLLQRFPSVKNSFQKNIMARLSLQDRKMALVQLASVEDAIGGLVKLHNYQLSETSHLRVSFSKSTI